MVVQGEPGLQQQAAFEHTAGHRRIADRTQQDGVMGAQFIDNAFGKHLAGRVVAPRAQVVVGRLDTGAHHVEH